MEMIIDITKGVYKERLVRCRDCRKKYACITYEGIANENGYCSLGETSETEKTPSTDCGWK